MNVTTSISVYLAQFLFLTHRDKGALAVHIGTFDTQNISKFIHVSVSGRRSFYTATAAVALHNVNNPTTSSLQGLLDGETKMRKMGVFPNIASVTEWDGGEAPVIEEEFSLEELMDEEL